MDNDLNELLAFHANITRGAAHSVSEPKANEYATKKLERKEILDIINCKYLASRFFGKPSAWLSQKINNHIKNGRLCDLTAAERQILKQSLITLAKEINAFADTL